MAARKYPWIVVEEDSGEHPPATTITVGVRDGSKYWRQSQVLINEEVQATIDQFEGYAKMVDRIELVDRYRLREYIKAILKAREDQEAHIKKE